MPLEHMSYAHQLYAHSFLTMNHKFLKVTLERKPINTEEMVEMKNFLNAMEKYAAHLPCDILDVLILESLREGEYFKTHKMAFTAKQRMHSAICQMVGYACPRTVGYYGKHFAALEKEIKENETNN